MKKVILLLCTAFAVGCGEKGVDVPVIEDFNINRYMGKWYEVARMDHIFEKGMNNVTAQYSIKDNGNIAVVNRGYIRDKNNWNSAKANGVATKTPNYFKVYFIPLVAGEYQVAYVDNEYSTAVVSGGSTKYLWFLSRTPEIPPVQL